ncbi:MAG TPA: HAD-IIIC family phosphatase [Terriglobales bacterium]|nr:HAD-IIIC family phosphatase [Terriglobales bacterium]
MKRGHPQRRGPDIVNLSEIKSEIDRLIASGEASAAISLLAELWSQDKSASAASFLVSHYEQQRPHLSVAPHKLAILRSFTVEPMVPLLRAAAFVAGIDLSVHLSEFNAYVQEIVDPQSALYRFAPDSVVLAVQTRDIAPELFRDFSGLSSEQVSVAVERVISDYRAWISNFRRHSRANLVVHNLEQPTHPARGLFEAQSPGNQTFAIQQINRGLRDIAAEQSGVYVLDYDALVARYGRLQWHDERKWLTVRLPISAPNLNHLVEEWMRFLHPLTGRVAKALVVDLDNTIWGGVIGEDGMSGIRLGSEYPGAAFQEVQRALLDLHRRGILLAIASKNNADDAMEALTKHPGMLLKPQHFACMRINWGDKAQSLREIARELNIGIDSLAFLDDNPIERRAVRTQAREVMVLDLPHEPGEFARIIREFPAFERLSLSAEDLQRGSYYQAQREREQLEQSITSREDFYRSLNQEVEIAGLTKATLPRIAQLTNKTNQFNLTTRRYTEQQISELVKLPGWHCFSIQVKDRFGDNGLVGVALTHHHEGIYEIDTLLMSCRVIGRTVETAFLSFLADHARKLKARKIQGWFLPTRKNAPARNFYSEHGFQALQENGEGTLWELDLAQSSLACPEWVRLHVVNGDRA